MHVWGTLWHSSGTRAAYTQDVMTLLLASVHLLQSQECYAYLTGEALLRAPGSRILLA